MTGIYLPTCMVDFNGFHVGNFFPSFYGSAVGHEAHLLKGTFVTQVISTSPTIPRCSMYGIYLPTKLGSLGGKCRYTPEV